MIQFELWTAFATASLLIAIIPGPGVASIVGFALSSGRRVALCSVAGMALGNAIAISASLAGAGAVLATSALAFNLLKWIGAAYLIGIGLFAILKGDGGGTAESPQPVVSMRVAFLTTAAVGTFHPKTILFFVAFAAQFISLDRPYLLQAAILVLTFTGIAAITDTLYALTASRTYSAVVRRPVIRRWSRRAGGGVLIAAGVATVAMRR